MVIIHLVLVVLTSQRNYDDDAILDDGSCDYPAEGADCTPFEFIQSSKQAFYYFTEAIDINDDLLDSEDWIGAFNGDVCVGAIKWDSSICNGLCAVPVMGDDGNDYSAGYMMDGQTPSFRIFDASENSIYDAVASSNEPWEDLAVYSVDSISAEIFGCLDQDDPNYNPDATFNYQPDCASSPWSYNVSIMQAFYFLKV